MADPKYFMMKSGQHYRTPRSSPTLSLVHALMKDRVEVQYSSGATVIPLSMSALQKQRKLLENKRVASVHRSKTQVKKEPEPEKAPKLSSSEQSLNDVLAHFKKRKGGIKPIAGFRYHSNGDERGPTFRKSSIPEFTGSSEAERLQMLKDYVMEAVMIHSENSPGESLYNSSVGDLVWREPHVPMFGKGSREENTATDGQQFSRPRQSLGRSPERVSLRRSQRNKSLPKGEFDFTQLPYILMRNSFQTKKYPIQENTAFMRAVFDQLGSFGGAGNSPNNAPSWYYMPPSPTKSEPPFRGGVRDYRRRKSTEFWTARYSEPAMQVSSSATSSPFSRTTSRFNFKYGVPSQTLNVRKPHLEEYRARELEKTSATNARIAQYIEQVQQAVRLRRSSAPT